MKIAGGRPSPFCGGEVSPVERCFMTLREWWRSHHDIMPRDDIVKLRTLTIPPRPVVDIILYADSPSFVSFYPFKVGNTWMILPEVFTWLSPVLFYFIIFARCLEKNKTTNPMRKQMTSTKSLFRHRHLWNRKNLMAIESTRILSQFFFSSSRLPLASRAFHSGKQNFQPTKKVLFFFFNICSAGPHCISVSWPLGDSIEKRINKSKQASRSARPNV